MSTTACAHPNIALVKYWGKQDAPGNLPVAPSLSVTLAGLTTTTTVGPADADRLLLNGEPSEDGKIHACLSRLRRHYSIPPLHIETRNDFPTAAGLASSASGFAALITAIDAECGLGMTAEERADQARQASGSAARSCYGGFVGLTGPHWSGEPLLAPADWPLEVVIAITTEAAKAVPSSEGMRASAASAYFPAWVSSTAADYEDARSAVAARDFPALARITEASCLKMHGLMLATPPGLIYWNAGTLSAVACVRALAADGIPVCFTIDAGPQLKAICAPGHGAAVAAELAAQPGVLSVRQVGLGEGARVIEAPR